MQIKHIIDARGLRCPEPLLKARQGLHQLAVGECLSIVTSDNTSLKDFQRMAELTQHQLIAVNETKQGFQYILKKG